MCNGDSQVKTNSLITCHFAIHKWELFMTTIYLIIHTSADTTSVTHNFAASPKLRYHFSSVSTVHVLCIIYIMTINHLFSMKNGYEGSFEVNIKYWFFSLIHIYPPEARKSVKQ